MKNDFLSSLDEILVDDKTDAVLFNRQSDDELRNNKTSILLGSTQYNLDETKQPEHENKNNESVMIEKQNKIKNWFEKVNEFEANISSIDSLKKEIVAIVHNSNQIVSFSFDDISVNDFYKIKIGAPIIFVYGKEIVCGSQTNSSRIYFRLERNWTKKEIDIANKEADRLIAALK